ncbi:MAG: Spy0128 family protein [Collinsella sp.]
MPQRARPVRKGVTYDDATYTVVTTVSDNGDGTLTARRTSSVRSAGFTNKYHAMPTQVSIGAIKVLEGRGAPRRTSLALSSLARLSSPPSPTMPTSKINFDKFEYDERNVRLHHQRGQGRRDRYDVRQVRLYRDRQRGRRRRG